MSRFCHRALLGASVTLGFTCALTMNAEAVTITPRLTGGFQDYEVAFSDVVLVDTVGNVTLRDGFDLQDRMSFGGVGFAASAGRLFLDASGQMSSTGQDSADILQGATIPGVISGNVGVDHSLDAQFRRRELNVALGWGFSPEFSAYLGYKVAKTNLENKLFPHITALPETGDVLFNGIRYIDFHYSGPFIGATYSLPLKNWGSIGVQSSIAFLDAGFREHFTGVIAIYQFPLGLIPVDPSYISKSRVSGRSKGVNVGLSWTGNLGAITSRLDRMSYTIGIDRSEYNFSTNDSQTGDFEERSTRLRLDLRYRFSTARE